MNWTNLFWTEVGALAGVLLWQIIILPILDALPPRGGFIDPRKKW